MAGRKFTLKFLMLPCIILLIVLMWQHEINNFSRENALIKQPAMRNAHQQKMELSIPSSSGRSSSGRSSRGKSSGGRSSNTWWRHEINNFSRENALIKQRAMRKAHQKIKLSIPLSSGTSSGGALSGGTSSGGTSPSGRSSSGRSSSGRSSSSTSTSGGSSSGTSSGGRSSGGRSTTWWQHDLNNFSRENALIKQPAMRKAHQQKMELSIPSSSGTSSRGTSSSSSSSRGPSSGGTSSGGTSSSGRSSSGTSSGGTSSGGRTTTWWQHKINNFSREDALMKQPAMRKAHQEKMEFSSPSLSGTSSSGISSSGTSSGGTSSDGASSRGTSSSGTSSSGTSSSDTSLSGTSSSGASSRGTSSSGTSSSGTSSSGTSSGGISSSGTSSSGTSSTGSSSVSTSSSGISATGTSLSGTSSVGTSSSGISATGSSSTGDVSNINKSENNTKTWLVVYWSTFFGKRLDLHEKWLKGECPVPCELTSDISRAKQADGFIVHARDPRPLPPIESVPWILQTQENPVYTPVLKDTSYMSKFNLLKSYRLDSDFPNPSVLLPNLTAPIPFKDKTGLIMAALSNCEPVRTEYMRQLMKFVQVDSYGACLHNKQGLVGRYGKDKGIDFRDAKTILARQYKFTLVFFNQDCDYFVDAQLHHAWNAGSVPIVMATDKLDEFLPGPYLSHSVIKVRDFKSPQLLADYIKYLSNNEAEYNTYLEWKWKGYGDITGTAIGDYWMPKYPMSCQVCVALSEGREHKDGLKVIPCNPRRFEDWGITKGG